MLDSELSTAVQTYLIEYEKQTGMQPMASELWEAAIKWFIKEKCGTLQVSKMISHKELHLSKQYEEYTEDMVKRHAMLALMDALGNELNWTTTKHPWSATIELCTNITFIKQKGDRCP